MADECGAAACRRPPRGCPPPSPSRPKGWSALLQHFHATHGLIRSLRWYSAPFPGKKPPSRQHGSMCDSEMHLAGAEEQLRVRSVHMEKYMEIEMPSWILCMLSFSLNI